MGQAVFFSGTSGRVSSVQVPYDGTVDLPVIIPGNFVTAPNAELNKWSASVKAEGAKFTGFENPVDGQGVVYALQLRGGLGSYTVTAAGTYNFDAAGHSDAKFAVGSFIVADLILQKNAGIGHKGCVLKITSVDNGEEVAGQPSTFSFTADGHGAMPVVTT